MKKLLLLATTFTAIPTLIIFCVIFLSYLIYTDKQLKLSQDHTRVAYAALPSTQNLLQDRINSKDARIEILQTFLKKYNSDLAPLSQHIVTIADKYNLDYRLVPAIAMQESNLCKKVPKDSHNCWGYAIYGSNLKKFTNYAVAIEAVSKTLATDYKQLGLVTPEEIMHKYTPSSNGSWANGVSHFMAELENTQLN